MSLPRICHVSTVHRGVEIRIVRKELAALAEAGFDAHAIISATPAEVQEAAKLGVTIHPLPENTGTSRLLRMTKKMYAAWKECRRLDARLYHFHDPELIPMGMLLKLFGYHVVMDVHEDLQSQVMTKQWIPSPIRRLVSKMARGAERLGARVFDAVVTSATMQAVFFEDVARRSVSVHNFPLLNELAIAPETPEGQEAPVRPATHIIYVGGITRLRGVNEAIYAAEKAKVKLILAGKFRSEEERQYAMTLPGWKNVEELGWVDRDGIMAAMAKSFAGMCALYNIPNHTNGYAIKMFEYMAAGIPVIVSNIPTWTPVIEQHDAGICVDPEDPDAVANAVITLRDNPQRAAEMGRNGRRAVLEHYNWEAQAKILVALYKEILKV